MSCNFEWLLSSLSNKLQAIEIDSDEGSKSKAWIVAVKEEKLALSSEFLLVSKRRL